MNEIPQPAPEQTAPLLAGEIQGVRSWQVLRGGASGPAILSSLSNGDYWPPSGLMQARCAACREPHTAPAGNCQCGLYAWHPWRVREDLYEGLDLLGQEAARPIVTGVIEAWGQVEVHAEGIRAERARVAQLFVGDGATAPHRQLLENLAASYKAQLVELEDVDHFEEYCLALPRALDRHLVWKLLVADAPLTLYPEALAFTTDRGEVVAGSGLLPDQLERSPTRWQNEWLCSNPGVRILRVAGTSFRESLLQDEAFAPGRPLRLVREPSNQADPAAIAVWDEGMSLQLGYVPAEVASEIGSDLADGLIKTARSIWQWRDLDTGRRIGIYVLLAAGDCIEVGDPGRRREGLIYDQLKGLY